MLTVRFEDIAAARGIYRVLGIEGEPHGSNFVMYDEETPVALWRMSIKLEEQPVGVIEDIVFADGVEEGDRLFFLHAMFFKLIEGTPLLLRIEGVKPEFAKFGFEERDGRMEVYSKDVNLHYACGGRRG